MQPGEFWSIGDYAIIGDLWSAPGRDLADALPVAGRDTIDLATGTGVTAIALARRGARSVVGVDAAASLLAEAARRAHAAGVDVHWIEADMTSVPLPDRTADVTTSTFGIIFAGDPNAAIAEAGRLTRPGGLIAFTSWSGPGLFGQVRQSLSPHFPDAPVPWHESADGIRSVVGEEAEIVERSFVLTAASPEAFVSQLERFSAPIIVASQTLGDRWARARLDLLEVVSRAGEITNSGFRAEVRYLVSTLTSA